MSIRPYWRTHPVSEWRENEQDIKSVRDSITCMCNDKWFVLSYEIGRPANIFVDICGVCDGVISKRKRKE